MLPHGRSTDYLIFEESIFFDVIKVPNGDYGWTLNLLAQGVSSTAIVISYHALWLPDDGGEHERRDQPETIQEAQRERTIGQTGRG
jgi:hypothetical protein